MQRDEEHLRLLSIFHYVAAGLMALFACIPIIHLVVGIVLLTASGRGDGDGDGPPGFVGWVFVSIASIAILGGWIVAACVLAAGRFLARRTHYTFCLVIAAIQCAFMPFGTVLGVFTIIVLVREDVKRLFATGPTRAAL